MRSRVSRIAAATDVEVEVSVANSPAIEWRSLYEAAALESDDSKLPERIDDAEAAIKKCLEALDGQPHDGEANTLHKALDALEVLRVERLSGRV